MNGLNANARKMIMCNKEGCDSILGKFRYIYYKTGKTYKVAQVIETDDGPVLFSNTVVEFLTEADAKNHMEFLNDKKNRV